MARHVLAYGLPDWVSGPRHKPSAEPWRHPGKGRRGTARGREREKEGGRGRKRGWVGWGSEKGEGKWRAGGRGGGVRWRKRETERQSEGEKVRQRGDRKGGGKERTACQKSLLTLLL